MRRTIPMMLVTTALFLGLASTSFAAAGTALSGSAGAAQYSQPTTQSAPTLVSAGPSPSVAVPTQQAAPSGAGLPMTGFAVITVLLLGIGLTGAGLVGRRFSGARRRVG